MEKARKHSRLNFANGRRTHSRGNIKYKRAATCSMTIRSLSGRRNEGKM